MVPRCTFAINTEGGDQGPYDASHVQSSGNYLSGLFSDSDPDSDLAPGDRRWVKTRSAV